jgi:hypothetical protein
MNGSKHSDAFVQFLKTNTLKYQGVTKEKFTEFYDQAKVHARGIAEAIGLDVSTIETDNVDTRLNAMIEEGSVELIDGLYWRDDAIKEAELDWAAIDSDSE